MAESYAPDLPCLISKDPIFVTRFILISAPVGLLLRVSTWVGRNSPQSNAQRMRLNHMAWISVPK